MKRSTRRRFLTSAGTVGAIALAGCSGSGGGSGGDGDGGDSGGDGGGDSGSDGGTTGSSGEDFASVTIQHPEGALQYALYESAQEQGFFEAEGIDLTTEYPPFPAQVQSISNGEVDVSGVSFIPYLRNYLQGQDVVTFGFSGCLQAVNGLYTRADSEYETVADLEGQRIGVWSFGSSTVQSFQAVLAEDTGLDLREDFEATTAAPPALLGLLQDGEVDGVINLSGLTVAMEAQPDTYRRLRSLNLAWQEISGNFLPITGWFADAGWYEENTEVAAGLLRASQRAVEYWRENSVSILEEYGETIGIDNQAKIDVVNELADQGQVFQQAPLEDSFVGSTWDFVDLMSEYGFVEEVVPQDEVLMNPL